MSTNTNRILVPIGFSEQSIQALDHAVLIAQKTNSEITLLSVLEDAGLFARLFDSEVEKQNDRMKAQVVTKLEELIEKHSGSGVRMTHMTAQGTVYEEIAEVAKMLDVDLVVMGTNGKPSNARKAVLGSNAYRVVNNVKPPVLTINGGIAPKPINRIIFPLVLDRRSREKVGPALHYSRIFGSEIRIVGVSKNKEEAKKLSANLKQTIAFIQEAGVKVEGEIIREDGKGVAEATLEYANKENGDLIIIMEEGDQGRNLRLRSSDVEKILYAAAMPVMSITPSKVAYESQFSNF
ncbi:MAG: universal stress protein [Flavobacteriia bacterium]|nr:universal stress protein [Flavobacteriia bacterium]